MHRKIALLLVILLGMVSPSPAAAVVKVFACEPEWAALAREIGGDKIDAYAATHARQDPHHIRARPSLIARIRRVDLVFCSGAGLEVGWLPLLLQRGARASVQPGKPGYLMAASHVAVVEKPEVLDRSLGDVHPEGNPHVHLNPHNILSLAQEVSKRLIGLDAVNAEYYRQRTETFVTLWTATIRLWEERARKLAGMPVIVHHKSWSYLIRWLGLREVATLEMKPGIPPSASHLNGLLQLARGEGAKAILRTPYDQPKAAEWLSGKTDIPSIVLPYTVEKDATPGDLARLFDQTLSLLEKANARP
jgi:zinc/manganese transport system substrate-binding protein